MSHFNISNEKFPGKYLPYEGKDKIWLGGTNYLSIGFHPLFQEKLREGIRLFPQNWGSSRKNNVKLDIYEKLENRLAEKFPGKGIAICSSGMAAAQTALYFIQKNRVELIPNLAPFTHPALWTPKTEVSKDTYLEWTQNISFSTDQLYCTDGIGAPMVQKFNLDWIQKTSAGSVIVIDESHRLGLTEINVESTSTLIQTASLSKAYGIPAGIIIGPSDWIYEIKKDPFWIGSSPPNPAFTFACLHAQEAYDEQSDRLVAILELFEQMFPFELNSKINRIKNYPGFSSFDTNLFQHLVDAGFLANLFSYPNINDPAFCKFIIHPMLTNEDIANLTSTITKYYV